MSHSSVAEFACYVQMLSNLVHAYYVCKRFKIQSTAFQVSFEISEAAASQTTTPSRQSSGLVDNTVILPLIAPIPIPQSELKRADFVEN